MHRLLLTLFGLLTMVYGGLAQIIGPTSTPVNSVANFSTPGGAYSNTWVFDDTIDFSGTVGTVANVLPSFNGTGSSTMTVDENGNWYLFASTLAASGEVYRLSFGQDPNSTPVQSVAVTVSGANHLAIDVVRDDVSGNWYGFMVAPNTMWRLDFGSSLNNTPTVSAPMSFADGIAGPRQITVVKDGGKWFAFVGNYLNKIGRFEFGASLANTPTNTSATMPSPTYTVGAVTGLGNYFAIHKENGNWYILATQYTLLYLVEFGSTFENTPTYKLVMEQQPPDNNFLRMISVGIVSDCENVVAYCMQGQGSKGMMKLDFHGSITNTPTVTNISGMTSSALNSVETAVPYVTDDGLYFVLNYWTAGTSYPLRRFKVLSFPTGVVGNANSVSKTWATTGNKDVRLISNMASPRGAFTYCNQVAVVSAGLPQPGSFTDSAQAVCAGATQVRYTVPPVVGATGYVWAFSGSGHTISGSGNSITIDFAANAQSGILSVHATNGSGAGAPRTISVTVAQNPTVSIAPVGADTICLGASTQITATQRPATRYQWMHNGSPVGQNNRVLTAATAGMYKVFVTDSVSGCSSTSDSVKLTTVTPPSASVVNGASVSVCQGDSVTLNAQPTGVGLRYRWIGGVSAANDTNAALVVKTAGNYRVVVSDARQCRDTSTVTMVVVHSRPTAQIQPAGSVSICQGDTISLDAGAQSGVIYKWFLNGNLQTVSGSIYGASVAGDYKVVVSNQNNCSDTSASTILSVIAPPVVSVTPTDTAFCAGGAVTLHVLTADTGLAYQWQDGSGNISGANASLYQTVFSGNYSVIASRQGISGCADTAFASVVVHPTPQPSILWNEPVLTSDSGYVDYEWFLDGTSVASGVSNTYTPVMRGAYMVQVTDSNGCVGVSSIFNIERLKVPGHDATARVKLYPNPVADILSVEVDVPVHVVVYDNAGKIVWDTKGINSINMAGRPDGIYLIRISDMQGHLIHHDRVIKMN